MNFNRRYLGLIAISLLVVSLSVYIPVALSTIDEKVSPRYPVCGEMGCGSRKCSGNLWNCPYDDCPCFN